MFTPRRIVAPDGVSLAARDAGAPEGRAFVFLHGIAQSAESFAPLFDGALARTHRLVAFDLRGHGDSDKPVDPSSYARAALADDLAAVIEQLRLRRPVLVAWSYGGVVAGEYLRRFGDAALGGVVWSAGAVKTGRDTRGLYGPVMLEHARALLSDDAEVYAAGARAFVRGCAATRLDEAFEARAVAQMARVPAHARRALLSGAEDYTADVARATTPMATVHGELDAVVTSAMSDLVETSRAGVTRCRLAGVGHLPWVEAQAEFEAALGGFEAIS